MDELLNPLRTRIAEPTRLRIVSTLDRIELTVTELCQVLGQSQPRVSRHLKLLCDSGVLERRAEGTNAFYRLTRSGVGRQLADQVLALIDDDDPIVSNDLARLAHVRSERAAAADRYFESVAGDWDRLRSLHVADDEVERAMIEAVGELDGAELLDIGTGTGRILEIFADRVSRGIGVDLSREMLNVARSRLDERGITHCSVEYGSAYSLPVEPGSVDVAVLHHVLHFLDDPASAITEAARTLRPHGRLIVVDFAPHQVESLRTDSAHRRLGFDGAELEHWFRAAGLVEPMVRHLVPDSDLAGETTGAGSALTVTLWVARQHHDAPYGRTLEVAQ